MSHSSDSDEFFDVEEITPSKICTVTDAKEEVKKEISQSGGKKDLNSASSNENQNNPNTISSNEKNDSPVASTSKKIKDVSVKSDSVDINPEKNFDQGRRKFREIRQTMQTEEEDCVPSTPSSQTSSVEGVFPTTSKAAHPFRIIEHDKISLQSLSSLGRIGRILNGSVDPSSISVGRESQISGGLSSTISETDGAGMNRVDNVLDLDEEVATGMQMQEPDVIASTKSNSLKHSQVPNYDQDTELQRNLPSSSISNEPQSLPVAPPRKRKKIRTDSAQSLPPPDPVQIVPETSAIPKSMPSERPERPTLKGLNVKPPTLSEILDNSSMVELSSPASTIESLTREFQNSLDLSLAENAEKVFNSSKDSFVDPGVFGGKLGSPANKSEASSRSSTIKSVNSQNSNNSSSSVKENHSLDIKSALKGQYVVKPQDEEKARASGPSKTELERLENLRKAFNATVSESNKNKNNSNANTSTGHSSLGSSNRSSGAVSDKSSKERRKSAGDENGLKQLNMYVRTRTDSGKELTDMEILEQVTVLNLDTGERVPLSVAEDKLPQCINPLSLHIMRLTSEYSSNSYLYGNDKQRDSDEESVISSRAGSSIGNKGGRSVTGSLTEGIDENAPGGLKKKTAKFKRFLGSTVKKTVNKAKSFAAEVSQARHKEDVADIVDEVRGEQNIKLKASNSHKGPYNFDGCVRHVQEFSDHVGPVWCMKFSQCGRLLATAGQDKVLRIWVVKDAFPFFQDMRTKYNANQQKSSPTPSQESLVSHQSIQSEDPSHSASQPDSPSAPFMPKPFCVYTGHTSDLLDVSWSKNYFVLSSSMDKTVRLWHISRKECLCCFQHIDFVTAIVFHPRDDRYFLSGSLDGKLRLWNIPDKKVAVWNEVDGQTKLITAANFCQNGKFAVVGSYDGRCIFYTTDQLKYHTQIDVRSSRGKNSTGRKISGIEPMPGEDKILVTSNDSRIRLYDLRDLSLSCKYKGYVNVSSQIKASFSHDGKFIVSGSENQCIYIWKTQHDFSKFTSVRRDRNDYWEGIKAHNAVVTCAVFAPNPENIIRMIDEREQIAKGTGPLELDPEKVEDPMVEQHTKGCGGHVLVSADFNGCIKVFVNKTKPKHSSLPVSALA